MGYTTNYHLPQWVESDRIMMGDFNDAMASIEEGMSSNAEAAAEKPYVVGSYTGTGQQMTITLGFRPSFLIINGGVITYSINSEELATWQLVTAGNVLPQCITFTDTGFTLLKIADNSYPQLTISQRKYDYIAFK